MTTSLDVRFAELCGIDFDYFNEYPSDKDTSLRCWMKIKFAGGSIGFLSYTERYKDHPDILNASDPDKIAELDCIAEEVKNAVRLGDIDRLRMLIKKVLLMKLRLSNFKPNGEVW